MVFGSDKLISLGHGESGHCSSIVGLSLQLVMTRYDLSFLSNSFFLFFFK